MNRILVTMKATGEAVKRIPVRVQFDAAEREDLITATARDGSVELPQPALSGRIYVDGRPHYQGKLEGEIPIELWSLAGGTTGVDAGAPQGIDGGSIAYPSMQIRSLRVDGREIATDSEGYIVHPGDWSEAFTQALAESEGLSLTDEHWEVVRYLRDFYNRKHVQCTVRDMIKHFRVTWGRERGSNRYLHQLFPRGGPQKQGNRLAGLLRTKGEH